MFRVFLNLGFILFFMLRFSAFVFYFFVRWLVFGIRNWISFIFVFRYGVSAFLVEVFFSKVVLSNDCVFSIKFLG